MVTFPDSHAAAVWNRANPGHSGIVLALAARQARLRNMAAVDQLFGLAHAGDVGARVARAVCVRTAA